VRVVDDHGPGLRPHGASHVIGVEGPAARRVERQQRHLRAERARDLVQRLVGRPSYDRVVARREQRVHRDEDALLGAGEHQHLVRVDPLIEPRDLGPQRRKAG
jgi:hypothetical protein